MTDHVALAHVDGNGLAAHVVPCVHRAGVWCAVKNTKCVPARWQVIHSPSGSAVRFDCGTKREAVAACKRLGEAYGAWRKRARFGAAMKPAPSALVKLAGAAPIVGVG